ncbi:MAG: pyridoxamine kinase [Clostridia bacterium]|nr:pyridoxamine kinase [Clostridia bacterium]
MIRQKRVAAIHDISCFGKCSLTVALPIISAAGVEVSAIPTAVLSTHTGGFTGYTYRDLTSDIMPIAKHWKSLDLEFDALYSGFLGSFEQIDIMRGVFSNFKGESTSVIVDPVMADNGSLYTIFPKNFPEGMRTLCAMADIITPNITEAVMMLGEEYREPPYTREYIDALLHRLADIGAPKIVLTGVCFNEDTLGSATYDAESGSVSYAFNNKIDGYYHGTGDVYTSALVAAYLCGRTLEDSARIAVDFTVGSIMRTKNAGTDIRFGVNFEAGLVDMVKDIQNA